MIDVSAGDIFVKSLEDSLSRMYKVMKDEILPSDLEYIVTLLNRIEPNLKCEGFCFDESAYGGVVVIPTFEEISNITRSLFDFDSKDATYTPKKYYVCVSPSIHYSSIRQVVALILLGIDNLCCPEKLLDLKTMILDNAITNNRLAGDRSFIFKNGTSFNINAVPLLLPAIIQLYENKRTYFSKEKLMAYLTDKDLADNKKESLVVTHSYLSDLPADSSLTKEEKDKEKVAFTNLFNNAIDNVFSYPENRGNIISMYNKVINNPTAGCFEKELANKALEVLNKNASSVFDDKLTELNIQESVKSLMEMRKKGYSDLELNELEVELETMQYSEDKMYLVTRVHRDISTANKIKRKKSKIEQEEIDEYILQLKDILKRIQAKKVRTDAEDFTILVKYPSGDYEE